MNETRKNLADAPFSIRNVAPFSLSRVSPAFLSDTLSSCFYTCCCVYQALRCDLYTALACIWNQAFKVSFTLAECLWKWSVTPYTLNWCTFLDDISNCLSCSVDGCIRSDGRCFVVLCIFPSWSLMFHQCYPLPLTWITSGILSTPSPCSTNVTPFP